MDAIRRNLFENPMYIYIALAFAELVLAAIWHEKRACKWLRWMLLPVALAGAVLLVERLVVTDREQIIDVAGQIARNIRDGNLQAVGEHLDDKFMGFYQNKALALDAARGAIERYGLNKVDIRDPDVQVDGDWAEMSVRTIIMSSRGEVAGQQFSIWWKVQWVRAADPADPSRTVWLVRNAEPETPGVQSQP